MSNVYLEKIATFQFPKSISRYARSRARLDNKSDFYRGPVRQIREFVKTVQGKGFHDRRAENAMKNYRTTYKEFYSPERSYSWSNYYDTRNRAAATGKMPYMSDHEQALYKSMEDLDNKKRKYLKNSIREYQAANLATKGARKTLKVIAGGTTAVGAAGAVAYNKLKSKD